MITMKRFINDNFRGVKADFARAFILPKPPQAIQKYFRNPEQWAIGEMDGKRYLVQIRGELKVPE